MGNHCEKCIHWRGDSMWKGNPCAKGSNPSECSEPWQICPFCKEAFSDDKCFSTALARIAALEAENERQRRAMSEALAAVRDGLPEVAIVCLEAALRGEEEG